VLTFSESNYLFLPFKAFVVWLSTYCNLSVLISRP
jgi:hypothetical protein